MNHQPPPERSSLLSHFAADRPLLGAAAHGLPSPGEWGPRAEGSQAAPFGVWLPDLGTGIAMVVWMHNGLSDGQPWAEFAEAV